ncbi:MAG: hypothetical protein Q8S06_10030 [Methanobacteriaceae archaeon]|nr:hypothetical protein [Methanobacteriaceae archaeon]
MFSTTCAASFTFTLAVALLSSGCGSKVSDVTFTKLVINPVAFTIAVIFIVVEFSCPRVPKFQVYMFPITENGTGVEDTKIRPVGHTSVTNTF